MNVIVDGYSMATDTVRRVGLTCWAIFTSAPPRIQHQRVWSPCVSRTEARRT